MGILGYATINDLLLLSASNKNWSIGTKHFFVYVEGKWIHESCENSFPQPLVNSLKNVLEFKNLKRRFEKFYNFDLGNFKRQKRESKRKKRITSNYMDTSIVPQGPHSNLEGHQAIIIINV